MAKRSTREPVPATRPTDKPVQATRPARKPRQATRPVRKSSTPKRAKRDEVRRPPPDPDPLVGMRGVDCRRHPERYRVGRGEQGVLTVEPYKSELLPLWRFRTPEVARESSRRLHEAFLRYKEQGDFVGMDMARKFLQMGWTRARRYANHASGRKYADGKLLPRVEDPVKAEAARIFYAVYVQAREDPEYRRLREEHRLRYG